MSGWLQGALARATSLPPSTGAVVMSTGIVCIDVDQIGLPVFTRVLLAIAVATWVVLAVAFLARLVSDRSGWGDAARSPTALTGVAATAVIGAGFARLHLQLPAWGALALAVLLWTVLLPLTLQRWCRRTTGGSFLVCVGTQSLVVLAATLAHRTHDRPFVLAADAVLVLGLGLYLLAVVTFRWRELLDGDGDHWILCGALSISALAAALLVGARAQPASIRTALRTGDVVLWALAGVGYLLLVGAELAAPRPNYRLERWSTVFPLGMTAAAAIAVAGTAHLPWLHTAGVILVWIAVAAWAAVATAAVRWLSRRTDRASARRPEAHRSRA
jgi:tellurite resistance protein TehA-like permease